MPLFSLRTRLVEIVRPPIQTVVGGWVPDPTKPLPETPETKPFEVLKAQLSSPANQNAYFVPENTPISDQLNVPACVSNACVDGFEILQGLNGTVIQMSRMFLHNNVRIKMGTLDQNDGAFIYLALFIMSKTGCIPENKYPYDPSKIHNRPPLELYAYGAANKLIGYYKITSTGANRVKDIILALLNNNVVVFGTEVGRTYQAYRGGTDSAFGIPNDSVGRHAQIITGFRIVNGRVQFWVRNSWSLGWGLYGHAWVDQDYITWSETKDLHVLTKMLPLAA